MVKEHLLQSSDRTTIEELQRNNRVMQSLKMNTSSAQNLKQKFDSWDDNLYKAEIAAAPTSGDVNKRHLTTTAQDFVINLTDISLYARSCPVWTSDKHGGLSLKIIFDKDMNCLSACNDTSNAQVIITELKLVVPVYKMEEAFAKELRSVQNEVNTFESYRVFPMLAVNAQESLVLNPGLNNVTGVALLSRISSEENTVGDLDTPASVRYITGCPNASITSLQVKIGDTLFPKRPITSQMDLFNYNKEFFKVNRDTDNGSLINFWNWSNGNQDTKDISLDATDMKHIYLDLSRNGLATGLEAKTRPIQVDISQSAVALLYYDVVVFYTKVVQIQNGEIVAHV